MQILANKSLVISSYDITNIPTKVNDKHYYDNKEFGFVAAYIEGDAKSLRIRANCNFKPLENFKYSYASKKIDIIFNKALNTDIVINTIIGCIPNARRVDYLDHFKGKYPYEPYGGIITLASINKPNLNEDDMNNILINILTKLDGIS